MDTNDDQLLLEDAQEGRPAKCKTQESSVIPGWLSSMTTLHLYTTCMRTYTLMWLV